MMCPGGDDRLRSYVSMPELIPVTLAPVSMRYYFPCALDAAPIAIHVSTLIESTYGCGWFIVSFRAESNTRHCLIYVHLELNKSKKRVYVRKQIYFMTVPSLALEWMIACLSDLLLRSNESSRVAPIAPTPIYYCFPAPAPRPGMWMLPPRSMSCACLLWASILLCKRPPSCL